MKQLLTLASLLIFIIPSFSQSPKEIDIPSDALQTIQLDAGLLDTDMENMLLIQQSTSRQNGATHHYFNQTVHDIPIHNAIMNIHTMDENVFHYGSSCVFNAQSKINTSQYLIKSHEALQEALVRKGIQSFSPELIEQDGSHYVYLKQDGVLSDIPVTLCYHKGNENTLILCWKIGLEMTNGHHAWLIFIDAASGAFIHEEDLMLSCTFDTEHTGHHCSTSHVSTPEKMMNPDSYDVYPFFVESPSHGDRSVVVDPAHPESSPFGWHDTNGLQGADTEITQGNNCHAYQDRNGDLASSGDEPSGGSALDFSFPFNPNTEPDAYIDFSVVQAFYTTNIAHDISYLYGFDEEHGNFQQVNYSGTDGGDDYINVLCQSRGDITPDSNDDTTDRNNANFFAGFQDGDKGRMRTYLWNEDVVDLPRLIISTPQSIAGGYISGLADFGPELTETPVTGELMLAEPILACEDITNDLDGKIAVINRGSCNFSAKVYRAQQQGAIAAIICNTDDEVLNMLGGDFAALVTIPSIIISNSDCQGILSEIPNGVVASLQIGQLTGPDELDASLDNGVVLHEFAHGISNRLVGGKMTTSCLQNQEQMGEGWSDFFALALTTTEGMLGEMPRGVGTYLLRESNDGQGLRTYPYSTDMNINPATYDDIITESIPHGVGMVWNAMLWDLYWALVDEYGFDSDVYQGNGGNNRCIQLVMDGMKLMPCEPGFVDGRDAILAADELNYGGVNACLIWEVFARRGLGFSAIQGSTDSRGDGQEAFDLSPVCVRDLKVTKTASPEVEAGDTIHYEIIVRNDLQETQTNVVVVDAIQPETNLVFNSVTISSPNTNAALVVNDLNIFIGQMTAGEEVRITYDVVTDPNLFSTFSFFDGFENGFSNWNNDGQWYLKSNLTYQGESTAFVDDIADLSDASLVMNSMVLNEANPTLRFVHFYDTDPAADGGLVEVSIDGGTTWLDVGDKIFRNGYRGNFQSNPLLNDRQGYWGFNGDFESSYVDLSDYVNEDVQVRFRFVTNTANEGNGWYVDDVGILELYTINSSVCVTSNEGASVCAEAPERGTIILPRMAIPEATVDFNVFVYPNPASNQEVLNVLIQSSTSSGRDVELKIFDLDGRLVYDAIEQMEFPIQNFPLPLSNVLKSGYYILHVKEGRFKFTEKILIKNE